jgi:hypothetical protein
MSFFIVSQKFNVVKFAFIFFCFWQGGFKFLVGLDPDPANKFGSDRNQIHLTRLLLTVLAILLRCIQLMSGQLAQLVNYT